MDDFEEAKKKLAWFLVGFFLEIAIALFALLACWAWSIVKIFQGDNGCFSVFITGIILFYILLPKNKIKKATEAIKLLNEISK